MELHFSMAKVIHTLFLNFNLCLEILFRDACKYKNKFNAYSLIKSLLENFNLRGFKDFCWRTFLLIWIERFPSMVARHHMIRVFNN